MAAPGRTWNDDEVQALLAIWADASFQKQLLGAVRNTTVTRCESGLRGVKVGYEVGKWVTRWESGLRGGKVGYEV